MIDFIKRKLKLGKYSDLAANMQVTKIKAALLEIKRIMDAGHNWESIWLCCTCEARALDKYLKQIGKPGLLQLNEDFGLQHYNITHCRLYPVHTIVSQIHDVEVNATHTCRTGSEESALMAKVRKELFNYWCKTLIGETL